MSNHKKTDLKQLAQQMAKLVSSFEDIKAFQKQLMQSFIGTEFCLNAVFYD